MRTVESAIDRVLAGPERKTRVMSDKERRVTAYHEGGHALVGHLLEHCDPIHKVSIVARGRALGWTLALPTEDRYTHTKSELVDRLAMLLGGRTAEEIVFGDVTTGAADDIDKATDIARAMVTTYGMSEAVGPIALGAKQGEVFLGKDYGHEANYSDSVAATIDTEVRLLVSDAHARAHAILTTYRSTLDKLAEEMLEHETLGDKELLEIFGDIETWVDPDPSGLADAPPAPVEPVPVAAPERAPVSATEAAPPEPAAARPGPCRARPRPVASPLAGPARDVRHVSVVPSDAEDERPTLAPEVDQERIAAAVREILEAIGEDPERDGLLDTPARVARMYAEIFAGIHDTPEKHLKTTFEADHDEMVMVRDIPIYSACEHHLIPFIGKAHIAYIPGRRRPHHRPVQAGPPGRRVRPPAPGPGAAHGADRRRARAGAQPTWRARRRPGRAPVHVDARRPQGRHHHGDLGGAGPVPIQHRHPLRGHAPHRPLAPGGFSRLPVTPGVTLRRDLSGRWRGRAGPGSAAQSAGARGWRGRAAR